MFFFLGSIDSIFLESKESFKLYSIDEYGESMT
jgi:hypothetical protein